MARAMITGFGPFAGWSRNSSEIALRRLAAGRPDLATRILTVDHAAAAAELCAALDAARPAILLATGLAPDPAPRLELRARPPESAGDAPVLAGLWPWESARRAMEEAGAAPRFSIDPGRYVCETVYWTALDRRRATGAPVLTAFLHLPPPGGVWSPERLEACVVACLGAAEAALSSA